MAKAFCIVNIVKIHDTEKFNEYVVGHASTLEPYGGRFLVKQARAEVIEGVWPANLMVVYEFASVEQFRAWYNSAEYEPWKTLRQSCADVNVILTEGG